MDREQNNGPSGMRIAFTLCSNNYLARAKTLGESLLEQNPGYKFVIGLVDKRSDLVDYRAFEEFELIEVEKVNIEGFDEIWKKYNIIELNTAVKPFFFSHIFKQYPESKSVIYFDPDIMLFGGLETVKEDLDNSWLVLTPHILSPINLDGCDPQESLFLLYGIYNLGFIALANAAQSFKFLEWWGERTSSLGYMRTQNGLFLDQLWLNLATVFFDNIKVSHNPGLNVAYWNLHERRISHGEGGFVVNGTYPLVFYHFSSYDFSAPSLSSFSQNRFSFDTRPDILELFEIYHQRLLANRHESFKGVECYYTIERNKKLATERKTRLVASKRAKVFRGLKRITPRFAKEFVIHLVDGVGKMRDA